MLSDFDRWQALSTSPATPFKAHLGEARRHVLRVFWVRPLIKVERALSYFRRRPVACTGGYGQGHYASNCPTCQKAAT